jgi:hypothetical protein
LANRRFGDVFGGGGSCVVDDRLVGRVGVVEPTRGGAVKQEVRVDERHGADSTRPVARRRNHAINSGAWCLRSCPFEQRSGLEVEGKLLIF